MGFSGGVEGGAAPDVDALIAMVQALPAKLLSMTRASAFCTSPSTPAQRASGVLHVLRRIEGGIVDAEPRAGSEAILSPEQQAELNALPSEKDVVRFMTPVLARLRGCVRRNELADPVAPILVNSEDLQWLEHPAGGGLTELRLKPDHFRTWVPFASLRKGGAKQGVGDDYAFGVLSGPALQRAGCLSELYEAKAANSLTLEHFGELCAYHDALGKGVCRGVLFGKRDFWLYKTVNACPVLLVRACWAASGSVDVFRAFFERDAGDELDVAEPRLLVLLRALLAHLAAVPGVAADGRCYLGSGATGHVFAVRVPTPGDAQPSPCALKVVLAATATGVGAEYAHMCKASEAGAPVIAPVVGSLMVEASGGGGFLLSRVGTAVVVTSLSSCTGVFTALASLHSAGVTHGDARLANLLCVDGSLQWIDLLGGGLPSSEPAFGGLACADAESLARSVLHAAAPAALPAPVRAALAAYAFGEPRAVSALAVAVWAAAAADSAVQADAGHAVFALK